jgi:hypothetical protein
MALTREMAQKVIDVVCKDPRCVHQIKAGNVNLAGLPRSNNVGMAVVRNVVNASGVAFGMLPDGDNSMLGSIGRGLDTASQVMPDSWGKNGSFRNVSIWLRGIDNEHPMVEAIVCKGIVDMTTDVLNRRVVEQGLKEFHVFQSIERNLAVYHSATRAATKDGGYYVFDWHATLNPENPMLSLRDDWFKGEGSVVFKDFTGFP